MEMGRDRSLDIAKAICIILMVIGHSGCPDYLYRAIYMFHMPCFFFISGWLLSDKYVADIKTGLLRKLKGSYQPFVKWSLIFLLCHNILAAIHIYPSVYNLRDFAEKVVRIFTMTGSESLLGGYWFLISLCWASVATIVILHLMAKNTVLTPVKQGGGVILGLLFLAIGETFLPFNIPQQFGSQTVLATAFYMAGYSLRKMDILFNHPLPMASAFLLIPGIAALFAQWGMVDLTAYFIIPYFIVALTGTLGVFNLSTWIARCRMADVLAYIGNKTLYILTFHFLAFKIVSYAIIRIDNRPISDLAQFPVLNNVAICSWLPYTVVGVVVPLMIWELFHLSSKIKQKTSKQR